ncbi:MAG: tyrosine-type recombinase/integrase [Eubacterium sp.]|nr:tyrosine-type recombinase/integrase [Eubacterium sp.]
MKKTPTTSPKVIGAIAKCDIHKTTSQANYINTVWYRKQQQSVLTSLSMKHTTHEARHTCITQMTIHNVNESVIKEIVGHKSAQSFTERVYTHIYLKTKIDAVNTIHT